MRYAIGFSRSVVSFPIVSDLIRKIEKRPYSHAYVRMVDPYTGRDIVFQASGKSVNRCNYEVFQTHSQTVKEYEIECSDVEFKETYTWLSDQLGKPYSRAQMFWLLIKKAFHVSGKVNNGDAEYVCSELAAKVLKIKRIPLPKFEDEITPSDLDRILESHGFPLT